MMDVFLLLIFVLVSFPSQTDSIRCYKCEATDECKRINHGRYDYSSDHLEIIDCEHHCWKAVSLGNTYRGCARKRCAVSHTLGAFSSSVCCGTDYCNGFDRMSSSKFLLMTTIWSTFVYRSI